MPDSAPVIRPLRDDEYDAFIERGMAFYVDDMVRAGIDRDVAQAKADKDLPHLLPEGLATPGHFMYAIEDEGGFAGYLWLCDRDGELGHSLFVYAVEIDDGFRGRGLGRAAMVFVETEAKRLGIAKVALNVFGGNAVARHLYLSLGYTETAVHMEKSVSTPGRIVVDRVSRTFRVYPKAQRTLKDVFVARGRLSARDVEALRDVSLTIEPGEAVGLVGRNGSGKSTLLRIVSGIISPTSGHVEAGGRVASLLELGAGFHPDFTGRENVYLNGSIHGLSRARVREVMDEIVSFAELEQFIDLPVRTYSSGMFMRLGFSVAAHIRADVLLLDEVFAVGDEQFQRKCFGKIAEFKNRGGTIVFVSHDARAVERLCDRAVLLRQGELAFDGSTRDAIAAYRRLLGAEESPEELGAGLREWGTGEARIAAAALVDASGEERAQFASGEPVLVRLVVEAEQDVAAPRVVLELRDDDGVVLGHVSQELAPLGWNGARRHEVSFRLDRLPLAEGRFHVRVSLADAATGALLHALDDALRLFVFPAGTEAGVVRLDGTWSMQEIDPVAPTPEP